MTQLDCTVTSCMYNKDNYCSKGDITVGGSNATTANETCCESFRERGSSMSNTVGHPSSTIDVDCEATKCVYNEKCKCHAGHIGIGGGSNVCDCKETECASFCCK
ncbi:MAG: DUF1540 domain-containing protein [Eubacterium sp.]